MVEHRTFNPSVEVSSPSRLMDVNFAGVAELADALDLGSSGLPVQVQVLLSAPKKSRALRALDFF